MKKLLVVISLAFFLFSCDIEDVKNDDANDPLVGMWRAIVGDQYKTVYSHIQFIDGHFFYYFDTFHPNQYEYHESYEGTYSYDKKNSTIIFHILEPVNETGVTSSPCRFYMDKLYCYGDKITKTDQPHEKIDISQFY